MSRSYLFLILLFMVLVTGHAQQDMSRSTPVDSLEHIIAEARTTIYNDFPAALVLLEKAMHVAEDSEDRLGVAEVEHLYAVAWYVKGNYDESLNYFLRALEIFRREGDLQGIAKCYLGQGLIQQGIDRHDEAVALFEKAIAAYRRSGDFSKANPAFVNIAISETELGQLTSAKKNLQKAYELSQKAGRADVEHMSLSKLGHIAFLEEEYEKAIDYYRRVLEHEKKPHNWEKSFAHAGLAEAYAAKNELSLAEEHGLLSMNYAGKAHSFWDLERNSKILATIYEGKGEMDHAYRFLLLNRRYADSLYNETKLREVNYLQLESKEADNLRLHAEKEIAEQQLLINRGFIAGMVVVILSLLMLLFLVRGNVRQKERFTTQLEQKNTTITQQNELISRQNEELKEMNSNKDRLFSILSHDLKSPIGSILQLLELIKSGEFSREEQDALLGDMLEQMKGTSVMLHNLLYWASGQMDGNRVNIRELDLRDQVSQALDAHYLVAEHKNIRIVHQAPDKVSRVMADAGHVSVILHNLLSNAIKFTIEGREIKITYQEREQEVALKIRDGGEGISEEKIMEIKSFNSRMISKLGTDMETGTGLGLLMVKQFLVANNARLDINSFHGEGSEFIVIFPTTSGGDN